MVDYSSWDKWAQEIGVDESEKEKEFSQEIAKAAYEAKQGKPLRHEKKNPMNEDGEDPVLEIPEEFTKKEKEKEKK